MQGKSWNTQHFYIAAAAADLSMYATFTKTPTQSKIPECSLSATSDEIVTKVEAFVTQSETFWEMLHSLFNKKVYLIGLLPLFIMKKLMKKKLLDSNIRHTNCFNETAEKLHICRTL